MKVFFKNQTCKLCLCMIIFLSSHYSNASDEIEFNSSFLQLKNPGSIDLSWFSTGANTPPGTYQADVYINDKLVTNSQIVIQPYKDKLTRVCLTESIIRKIDFDYAVLPSNFVAEINKNTQCIDIENIIPDASVNFESNESRLNIQVPQLYIKKIARGFVETDLWDQGITSATFNYNVNGYNQDSYGKNRQSAYASLSTGINIGSWYFRQNGNLSWSDSHGSRYSSLDAYIQKDISEWQGRIIIGQTNTQGQLFDTIPFTGIQFNTDERMLPTSQRGYAPEIHGVARTTARVTVTQNNQLIYETTVSPGEFVINDLYPAGFGGNLDVIVFEANGTEQHFSVAYDSMAQLLRPGFQRFSAVIGQYNNDSFPLFKKATRLAF